MRFLKYVSLLIILIIIPVFAEAGEMLNLEFVEGEYASGTTCPKVKDTRFAVVCGTVRSAMPAPDTTNKFAPTNIAGQGIGGVTIAIYECAPYILDEVTGIYTPNSSCKKDGNLTHLFTDTYTITGNTVAVNALGQYRTVMARAGGAKKRYVVAYCNKNVADVYQIPSYKDVELNMFINCNASAYMKSPDNAKYVDRRGHLSCDMLPGTDTEPLTQEVEYKINKPKSTVNFFLDLVGADARFVPPSGGDLYELIGNVGGPTQGAFWSLDCLKKYASSPKIAALCRQPGEDIEKYLSRFYTSAPIVIQNKLPNIPPVATGLIFFKEFTPRQDMIEYVQKPDKPAQYLHTVFGNCVGRVYLRKFGKVPKKPTELISCEEFKKCNDAISVKGDEVSYRNYQNYSGYAKMLSNPSDFEDKFDDVDLTQKVCQTEDKQIITIGDIQPSWDICTPTKTDFCGYKLPKDYFSVEFMYYYGTDGSTSKLGYTFETKQDSYTGFTPNQKPFQSKEEAGGDPNKGGTNVIISNGDVNSNNSLISAESISNTGTKQNPKDIDPVTGKAKTGEALTDILSMPYELATDKFKYLAGSKIYHKDIGVNHCLYSRVNGDDVPIINYLNDKIFPMALNNMFGGNSDHYPKGGYGGEFDIKDGTRSATSGIYITTPALYRMRYLQSKLGSGTLSENWNVLEIAGRDFYDSILTASYGDGTVSVKDVWDASNTVLQSFFGGSLYKTFLDRDQDRASKLNNPQLRDDLKVNFADASISEETFKEAFPLPNTADNDLFPGDWSKGENYPCYPWNDVPYKSGRDKNSCNTSDIEGTERISRTCRVDDCQRVVLVKYFSCASLTGTPSNVRDDLVRSSCGENARLRCAQGQETTMLVETDEGGNIVYTYDAPVARDELDFNPSCSDNNCGDIQEDGTYNCSEESSDYYPLCDMSVAGPFMCKGDIKQKDSNMGVVQTQLSSNETLYGLDYMAVSENYYNKLFGNPYMSPSTYLPGAEVSGDSSIRKTVTGGSNTKGKDTVGTGSGAKSAMMSHFAYPVSFDSTPSYPPIKVYCNNLEFNTTSEAWKCDIPPVPNPEYVALKDLPIDGSCELTLTSGCMEAIREMSGVWGNQLPDAFRYSDTFQKVVSAAASRSNIPASILIAYMARVGSLYKYSYEYEKTNEISLIDASSPWYGGLGDCDESDLGAIGPYDIIDSYFNAFVRSGGDEVLNGLASGRGKTASRCNFLDTSYVIAHEFSKGYSSCSMDWTMAREKIYTMTWGSDRQGSYAKDKMLDEAWSPVAEIYRACSPNTGGNGNPGDGDQL